MPGSLSAQPPLTLHHQLMHKVLMVIKVKVTYELSNMDFHSINCRVLNLKTTD